MKLTEHIAKGQLCALRFFPPCSEETVVPCHLPWTARKGLGMKIPDIFCVPGCAKCHRLMDQRDPAVPKALREERMRVAMMETLERLVRDGVVKVPK